MVSFSSGVNVRLLFPSFFFFFFNFTICSIVKQRNGHLIIFSSFTVFVLIDWVKEYCNQIKLIIWSVGIRMRGPKNAKINYCEKWTTFLWVTSTYYYMLLWLFWVSIISVSSDNNCRDSKDAQKIGNKT